MWEYTIGKCNQCQISISIDEPYEKLGKTVLEGILCEKCSMEKEIKEIEDYITSCEDDDGFVFDNKAESLLNNALNIINCYKTTLVTIEECYKNREDDIDFYWKTLLKINEITADPNKKVDEKLIEIDDLVYSVIRDIEPFG